MIYDIVIEGGQVFDGTGQPPQQIDIAIKHGKIAVVGDLRAAKAYHVLKAEGLAVAPGFIDMLSHVDNYWTLFDYPTSDSLIAQGVTTVVAGNCGSSLAPLVSHDSLLALRKWSGDRKLTVQWQTFGEMLAALEGHGLYVNFASLVGHSTLRRGYLKDELRELTEDEMDSLIDTLQRALEEGAFGLSSGLAYAHEYFTKAEELAPFLTATARIDGLYSAHLRNEGEGLVPAVTEFLEMVRATGVRAKIAHFKAKGSDNWPQLAQAMELIAAAQKEGQEIHFDAYPYDRTLSVLYNYLPSWSFLGGRKVLLANLTGKRSRRKLIGDMQAQKHHYENLIVAAAPRLAGLVGRSFADIAHDAGTPVEAAVLDALSAADGQLMVFDPSLDLKQVKQIISDERCLLGSDAGAYTQDAQKSGSLVHPRSFANVTQFLLWVRDSQMMGMAAAIAKLTSVPARVLGLKHRGTLTKGAAADVLLFNPDELAAPASYDHPYQLAQGMHTVVMNGRVVFEDKQITGTAAGRALRRGID